MLIRLLDVIFWILAGLAGIWAFWIMDLKFSFLTFAPLIFVFLLKLAVLYILGFIKDPKDILKLFK